MLLRKKSAKKKGKSIDEKISYIDVIDDLCTLRSFLDVCTSALNNKEEDASRDVASALFFLCAFRISV